MSMLKICGVDLELDLFDADVIEKFEVAVKKVLDGVHELKAAEENGDSLSSADDMRKACGYVKNFFDEMFGQGTAKRMFGEKNNLLVCMDAFGAVCSEANKMKGQVAALTNKYDMNRAQRRGYDRKNKHNGKNRQNGPRVVQDNGRERE